MRIYVAGPMRGHPEFNFPAFADATARLRDLGYEVFSPAERDLDSGFDPTGMAGTDEELAAAGFNLRNAMAHDTAWICANANAVFLLDGWERSSGARAEKALAEALGLLVLYEASESVLDTAARLTSSDRHDVYGHPRDNFAQIAELWSGYLRHDVSADDVAVCNVLQKVARLSTTPGHHDSIVDIAGYARTLQMLHEAPPEVSELLTAHKEAR